MNILPGSVWGALFCVAVVVTVRVVVVAVYRRYLHPLARVPGPFLAAVTSLYPYYFNGVKDGLFYLEIERLHDVYGPIVRIAPNEIHLSDPSHYDKIYSVGSKYDKDPVFYGALGDETFFSVSPHVRHRQLRAPFNPFFSRRAVLDLEGTVQAKVELLCRLLGEALGAGAEFHLHDAFRALALDVFTDYAFDDCWDHLQSPAFGAWFSRMIRSSGKTLWIFQHFPRVRALLLSLPEAVVRRLSPTIGDMLDTKLKARRHVEDVQLRIERGIKPRRKTIFHNLLDPELNLTGQLPTTDYMADEAFSLGAAASDTSGNVMTVATYHTIKNPQIYESVKRELREAFPDPTQRLAFKDLEKLPYLGGIVKEGQRLTYGVISRQPRVVPPGGAIFDDYPVPEGTIVSMSSYGMHRNKEAFPEPDKFDPWRWIDQPADVLRLREKCFVPFGRGSRSCLGQNLAACELFVALGTLFRRFETLETPTVEDMSYVDYFNIFHAAEVPPLKTVTGTA